MNIYLDNAATAPLKENVKNYIIDILDVYGNPSSIYEDGLKAKRIINQARNNAAKFINANVFEVIFTSSGSASNTLGIVGYCAQDKENVSLYYSSIAHKSIQKCASYYNGIPIPVNDKGIIDVAWLDATLKNDNRKKLVVVDYANSEIGTIQDIKTIINIVHDNNGVCFVDCTGSISTIPVDVKQLDVDMLAFSAHKLGALKGCGVLYRKSNIPLKPLIYGSQESGLFGGTENVIGIAALGKAVEDYQYDTCIAENTKYVLDYIKTNIFKSYLVGSNYRLPNNLYICFQGISGESLMTLLDIDGIQVSTGSACTSGDRIDSPTLLAIGMKPEDIRSCIRMTFNGNETKAELDYVCKRLDTNVYLLRTLSE